jgi:prevent-host-death family protein
MRVTATELNKRPGTYMTEALKEPVIVEKTGRPFAVIIPYDQYMKLEDAYWGELACKADEERSLGVKKSMDFLLSDDK